VQSIVGSWKSNDESLAIVQINDGTRRINLGTMAYSPKDSGIAWLLSSDEFRAIVELPNWLLVTSLLTRDRELAKTSR